MVDIRIQVAIPEDEKVRDAIFATITPTATADAKTSIITVQDVYNKFAQPIIRSKVREIFSMYKDNDDVMTHFKVINAEISTMILKAVKDSKAPFTVLNAELSNVQEDPVILASKTKLIAAANEVKAIEQVGAAIRSNPYYLEARRLDVLETIGATSKSNLVVMDTKGSTSFVLPTTTTTTITPITK